MIRVRVTPSVVAGAIAGGQSRPAAQSSRYRDRCGRGLIGVESHDLG
ncbi:hypothetical protein GS505_12200 [Rhodococcus hoagii]|uniref:Uncharacterized protein n=1 Tax=Rhodococcus hoagii TaxID=43767 RepID=A0AAE5CF27_RHOHA|nr:hypothetical protein [Prescottella equi]